MFQVCLNYTVLYVPCSLVVTYWERADLLALLCVMFPCVFVTFPYGVSGQVWYLIVLISDLCLLVYFCLRTQHIAFGESLTKSIETAGKEPFYFNKRVFLTIRI